MNMDDAISIALAMYVGEPCRICGIDITADDMRLDSPDSGAVFAGYAAGNVARSAHQRCWKARNGDKANWAYPEDAVVNKKPVYPNERDCQRLSDAHAARCFGE